MRIALMLRSDADAHSGGDVVQARAIARYLRQLGAEVRESKGLAPRLLDCDAAIVLNLTVPEQAWLQARACRRARVPYILLPVFWDLPSAIPQEQAPTAARTLPPGSRRRGAVQRVRLMAHDLSSVLTVSGFALPAYLAARDRDLISRVVAGADAVCPNSWAELEHLAEYARLEPQKRWVVVRNGLWEADLPPLADLTDPADRDDVVVSVGAISPRKNTLGLMRAARHLTCPVLVVGQHPRQGDAYASRVMTEAPPNVKFVGPLPRTEVLELLGRTRTHVQPGFVETPGLASLEAAALGAAVALSDTGPVREYFGSDGYYADPSNPEAIAQAVQAAREQGPRPGLAQRVRQQYDWGEVLQPLARLCGV